ncbi:GMC oxidoreductase [Cadophora sp. DSE1049]|nr:GMC oxidoreductase [Cadophora sp. DSE1049]
MPPHPEDTSSTENLEQQYDFIIIGGGTAGLVLAARLTEDPSVHALVLEAGANRQDDPLIMTPGLTFGMYDNPNYDWCLQTVPQSGLNNRILPQQRGKVLGGSSSIFQMQMVYTSKPAFDAWEKLGNPGWNWETMLPYLRKFHTHHNPGPADPVREIVSLSNHDDALESSEGPVQTSFSETGDLEKAWYEAWGKIMKDLKYEGTDIGGLAHPSSIDPKTRTRSSATTAYYSADVSSRANLRVVTDALVSKIVLERKDDEVIATGVQFVSKLGQDIIVKAIKEVILSAGTMKSPQILELSGIGDFKLLEQHGIKTFVNNSSVGENLQDHLIVSVSFEAADGVKTGEIMMRDPSVMPALMAMYQKDHSGPLGNHFVPMAQFRVPETFGPNGTEYIPSLLKTVSAEGTTEHQRSKDTITADLLSSATMQQMIAKMQFNISAGSKITEMVKGDVDGNYISFMAALNHPFSRGSIHIASASPTDNPLIDPKYLSHPMDIELCARHVQFLSTLTATTPLSQFLKPAGRRIPAYAFAEGKEMDLETAKKVVREHSISNYHTAGTCGMGPRDAGGVVDAELKVYGVKGLRVVDASVFPILPRGNIITSVYAVAERAADIIKAEWKGK